MINRIHHIIKTKQLNIEVKHVFSHLLDEGKENNKEKDRKMKIMKEEYGNFYETALIGNKKADETTKSTNTIAKVPRNPLSFNRFILIESDKVREGNPFQIIMEELRTQRTNKWRSAGKTLKPIIDNKVEVEASVWPLKNKKQKIYKSLQ